MWFPELIAYSVGLAKILSVSELKAVLAHELGHIVLRRTLFAWLRVFALTALRLVSALGDRTVAALVLLSIVVFILGSKEDSLLGYTVWVLSFAFLAEYLFLIVTIPFSLWCSRKNEHAADAFAALVVHLISCPPPTRGEEFLPPRDLRVKKNAEIRTASRVMGNALFCLQT